MFKQTRSGAHRGLEKAAADHSTTAVKLHADSIARNTGRCSGLNSMLAQTANGQVSGASPASHALVRFKCDKGERAINVYYGVKLITGLPPRRLGPDVSPLCRLRRAKRELADLARHDSRRIRTKRAKSTRLAETLELKKCP
jgi:hypothetical protein